MGDRKNDDNDDDDNMIQKVSRKKKKKKTKRNERTIEAADAWIEEIATSNEKGTIRTSRARISIISLIFHITISQYLLTCNDKYDENLTRFALEHRYKYAILF